MSEVIDCPSGLRVQVRGLKGKEGKLLSDRNAIKSGTFLDQILTACTEAVIDPGPYALPANDNGGRVDWSKFLLGDRFYALLRIRILTLGADYVFKTQCTQEFCRERFDYGINLETDLPTKRMSEEDRAVFRTTGVFTTQMKDGRGVKYRLLTGADEQKAARFRKVENAIIDALAMRIVEIDGVDEVRQQDIGSERVVRSIRMWLEDCGWDELMDLLGRFDEHDCGVETNIEIECPFCRSVQDAALPFERAFFIPSSAGKAA